MKELMTKSFWESVRKTFEEALQGPPAKASDPGVPAAAEVNDQSAPGTPVKEHGVRPGPREAEIK